MSFQIGQNSHLQKMVLELDGRFFVVKASAETGQNENQEREHRQRSVKRELFFQIVFFFVERHGQCHHACAGQQLGHVLERNLTLRGR